MKTTSLAALAILSLISCKSEKTSASVKPYPLDTCLISGEKLGQMGKPHEIVYQGQQIKFCCSNCEPDFKKAPEKYLSLLK